MNTGIIAFNILTILIGIGSIIANIWIARYNIGKNRTIYDVEKIPDWDRGLARAIRPKLKSGEYTILNIFQDKGNTSNLICILGKIKKNEEVKIKEVPK